MKHKRLIGILIIITACFTAFSFIARAQIGVDPLQPFRFFGSVIAPRSTSSPVVIGAQSTSSGQIFQVSGDGRITGVLTVGSCVGCGGGGGDQNWQLSGTVLTATTTANLVQMFALASSTELQTPSATISLLTVVATTTFNTGGISLKAPDTSGSYALNIQDTMSRTSGDIFRIRNSIANRNIMAVSRYGNFGFGYDSTEPLYTVGDVLSFLQLDSRLPGGVPLNSGIKVQIRHDSSSQVSTYFNGIYATAQVQQASGTPTFPATLFSVFIPTGNNASSMSGKAGASLRLRTTGNIGTSPLIARDASESSRANYPSGDYDILPDLYIDQVGVGTIGSLPQRMSPIRAGLVVPIPVQGTSSPQGIFGQSWAIYGHDPMSGTSIMNAADLGFMRIPYPRRTSTSSIRSTQLWFEPWGISSTIKNASTGDVWFADGSESTTTLRSKGLVQCTPNCVPLLSGTSSVPGAVGFFTASTSINSSGNLTWDNTNSIFTVNGTSHLQGVRIATTSASSFGETVTIAVDPSAGGYPLIFNNGTNQAGFFMNDTGAPGLVIGAFSPNTTLDFYTANTGRMHIDSAGNVAIGPNLPSDFLDVQGNATIQGRLIIGQAPLIVGNLPLASATSSNILLGQTGGLNGGSASGTYIGINRAAVFNGDFVNFQNNDVTRFKVSATGTVYAAGKIGVNTLSPITPLHVVGSSTFVGHVNSTGTVPTVTSCGAGPSIIGTDSVGQVTVGAVVTSCVVNFAERYKSPPICAATTDGAAGLALSVQETTSTVTFNATGLGGTKVNYFCFSLD